MSEKGNTAMLQNEEQLRILNAIDEMRDLGVNEDISIPQIIVVGDQSSGKSSTLQAITHMPLAVDSELCTRFATQIVLRRTPTSLVKVSIIPSSRTDDETKEHLQEFVREFSEQEFNEDGIFASIVNEAAEHMGLPTPGSNIDEEFEKRFSGDVLKIEVNGPTQPHLSVVDVPGLFHNDTKYQTKEDLETVRRLIKEYMDNPRSIILAVMDARVNISNQEIFRLAREADKDGSRTVGVVTKCDAIQRGDEKEALNIAQNAAEKLTHGWFLVKNRSTQDILDGVTLQKRDANERSFFQNAPWNSLSKERVGVKALTRFLSQLLLNHIKKEFPQLLNEIEALVTKTESQLKSYGEPRQTNSEQRRFLRKMASNYRKSIEDALVGVYDSDSAADDPADDPTRLRWHIRTRDEAFAQKFAREGHQWVFKTSANTDDPEFCHHPPEKNSYTTPQESETEKDIYYWIRKVHTESKGIELSGTMNPQIVTTVFRKQTESWGTLSRDHLSGVKQVVDRYLEVTFKKVVQDPDTLDKLTRFLRPRIAEGNLKADKELEMLLHDECLGILQTVNNYHAETLQKMRSDREVQRLKDMELLAIQPDTQSEVVHKLAIVAIASNDSEGDIHDIHDVVKSYYQVAMRRFLDNVIIQVIERHILGPKSPLRLFSSDFVDDLEDDQVKSLATENSSITMARSDLQTKLDRLNKALDIASRASLSWFN